MSYTGSKSLVNQILLQESFLSNKECESLRKLLEETKSWESDDDYKNLLLGYSDKESRQAHSDIAFYMLKAKLEIENFYGDDFLVGRPGLRKWSVDEEVGLHADNCDENGVITSSGQVTRELSTVTRTCNDVTVLLYINEDFAGGTLEFPLIGKQVQPKTGMLVAFPSSRYFPHLVSKIENGTRYSVFSFFSRMRTMAHFLSRPPSENWKDCFVNSEDIYDFWND